MKTKALIIAASIIGAIATVCTIAGFVIYGCINELNNVDFIFDIPKTEEQK